MTISEIIAAPLEDIAEEEEQVEEDDGDIGEEDEMADFIVDEEDEHRAPPKYILSCWVHFNLYWRVSFFSQAT